MKPWVLSHSGTSHPLRPPPATSGFIDPGRMRSAPAALRANRSIDPPAPCELLAWANKPSAASKSSTSACFRRSAKTKIDLSWVRWWWRRPVEESSRKWKWNNEPNQPLIHCVPLGEGSPEFTNIMDSSKTKQFVLNTTRYYYRHIHRSPAYVVYSYTSAEELAIDACPDEIFYNRYIIHSAQTPLYILPTSACFITRCPRHVSRWAKDSEGRRSSFDWHEVCLAWGHP